MKAEGEKGVKRIRWLDDITDAMDMNLGKLGKMGRTGRPGVLQSMGSQRTGHSWGTEQQQQHKFRIRKLKNTLVDLVYHSKDLVLFDLPLTFISKMFVSF